MMKIVTCIGLVAATVFVYIVMLATQGATNDLVATANATGNWTAAEDFALAQRTMNAWPLLQWFLLGAGCLILLAVVLKGKD